MSREPPNIVAWSLTKAIADSGQFASYYDVLNKLLQHFRVADIRELHQSTIPCLDYLWFIDQKLTPFLHHWISNQAIITYHELEKAAVRYLVSLGATQFKASGQDENPDEINIDDDDDNVEENNFSQEIEFSMFGVGSLTCHPIIVSYFSFVPKSISTQPTLSEVYRLNHEWRITRNNKHLSFTTFLKEHLGSDPRSHGVLINEKLLNGADAVAYSNAMSEIHKSHRAALEHSQQSGSSHKRPRLEASNSTGNGRNMSEETSSTIDDGDKTPLGENSDDAVPKRVVVDLLPPTQSSIGKLLDAVRKSLGNAWSPSYSKIKACVVKELPKETSKINFVVDSITELVFLHMGKSRDRCKRFQAVRDLGERSVSVPLNNQTTITPTELAQLPCYGIAEVEVSQVDEVLDHVVEPALLDGCIPPAAIVDVGRWGEQLVYQYLMKTMVPKGYSVEWTNKDTEETCFYDLKIMSRNPNQIRDTVFIEVKSTQHNHRPIFETSPWEYDFMRQAHDSNLKYHIYRVSNALSANASIEVIVNPMKRLLERKMQLLLKHR